MAGITPYGAGATLSAITGRSSFPALGLTFVGLLSSISGAQGTLAFSEPPASSGYGRAPIVPSSWGAPVANASPPYSTISNNVAIAFNASSGAWGTVQGWALFDGSGSAANMLWWDWLGGFPWLPFYAASGAGTAPGVFDVAAHGYSNGDQAVLTAEFGGSLPTSVSNLAVPLTVAGATADTFNLGVITSSSGSGMVRKVVTQTVNTGIVVTLNAGAIVLQL